MSDTSKCQNESGTQSYIHSYTLRDGVMDYWRLGYCNYCRGVTETKNGDCVHCGLSKVGE